MESKGDHGSHSSVMVSKLTWQPDGHDSSTSQRGRIDQN